MNLIDRTVAFFSPEAGLRRQRARLASSAMRSYAGAKDARGRQGWDARPTGANAEIGPSMVRLRNRIRQLVRDDSLAKRVVDLWTLHLVGDGITLDFFGPEADAMNAAWLEWFETTQCDAEGQLDGYGLQAQAVAMMVESGGALVRRRWRSRKSYPWLAVPFQLQVLEPDFIDHGKGGINPLTGNPIIQGIEFDKKNPSRRVGFWLWPEHPGENSAAPRRGLQSQFVDADDVIYMFRKHRNNVHGVTWLHAVVTRLKDLDDYIEALLMKAKVEACFTILVETEDGNAPPGSSAAPKSEAFELEPGMVRRLAKGETAKAFDPGNSSGHSMLLQSFIRFIAIGVGLTYDQAYSDLTGANYSSLRAGKMEFQATVSQHQWHTVIPQMVEPIARWFAEAGERAGRWSAEGARPEIETPKVQTVDPKKDGDAEVLEVENGFSTWAQKVKARGLNPRRHVEALKAEVAEFEKAGLRHPFAQPKEKPAAPAAAPGKEDDE